jgi:uncharacterized protein YdhG (YjbR/CyaY superfamily)
METKRSSATTIDEYIADFPKDIQDILQKIRRIVQEAAPEAREAIKYQIPTFTLNRNLVHFAAFKNHIGFYPTPSGTAKFRKQLSSYQAAKGSVQFPLDQPIPYELIREIVVFRVKEEQQKTATKARPKKKTT